MQSKKITDIDIKVFHGRFEDHVTEILTWIGPSRSTFVLTFVDPNGWSVDLKAIKPLWPVNRARPSNNFMYKLHAPFPDHPDEKVQVPYDLPLGKGLASKARCFPAVR